MADLDGFREIPGFPARYLINEDGTRVIGPGGGRWPKNRDLTIRMSYERHGSSYLQVKLGNRYYTIHYLVAITYVGPRPDGPRGPAGPHVRHLDNNSLNNHYSNLEWGSPTDNAGDLLRDGRHVSQVLWAAKTHCPQGHEYTPENTLVTKQSRGRPGSARQCRECNRQRKRAWVEKNRERTREYSRDYYWEHKTSSPE